MPKKHTPSYTTAKPQALPHSSLATTTAAPVAEPPKSVNERIRDYRAQAASSTVRSISTNEDILRALTAESRALPAAPRLPHRPRDPRTPGPAAPKSWDPATADSTAGGIIGSTHGPRPVATREKTKFLSTGLPDYPSVAPRSLRSTTFRVLAKSLDVESARDIVGCLNSVMKMQLIEIMAQSDCLDRHIVNVILSPLQDYDGKMISGGQSMSHIVLGLMMKTIYDWNLLRKLLRRPPAQNVVEIPESWDADGNNHTDDNESPIKIPSIRLPMLPHLTHLSLSQAPLADWNSLLRLVTVPGNPLSHLTHLDLSYWTAPVNDELVKMPYSWAGPHRIWLPGELATGIGRLNALGKMCRGLIWLGLGGNEDWIRILTESLEQRPLPRSRFELEDRRTIWTTGNPVRIDWTGIWRGLQTISIPQSWAPPGFQRQQQQSPALHTEVEGTQGKLGGRFANWWDTERTYRKWEADIRASRLAANLRSIKFEYTPVADWADLEIRELKTIRAVERYRTYLNGLEKEM